MGEGSWGEEDVKLGWGNNFGQPGVDDDNVNDNDNGDAGADNDDDNEERGMIRARLVN